MCMEAILTLAGVVIGAGAALLAQIISRRQALQLTAAERRLQAQQEAFALWWKLAVSRRDSEKRKSATEECERFWNENCLYLGRKTRKAFRDTLIDLVMFNLDDPKPAELKELNVKIEMVFRTIMSDAELPELTESLVDVRNWTATQE